MVFEGLDGLVLVTSTGTEADSANRGEYTYRAIKHIFRRGLNFDEQAKSYHEPGTANPIYGTAERPWVEELVSDTATEWTLMHNPQLQPLVQPLLRRTVEALGQFEHAQRSKYLKKVGIYMQDRQGIQTRADRTIDYFIGMAPGNAAAARTIFSDGHIRYVGVVYDIGQFTGLDPITNGWGNALPSKYEQMYADLEHATTVTMERVREERSI